MRINLDEEISKQLSEHIKSVENTAKELKVGISQLAEEIFKALRRGKKLLIMGNGGSAADSQHFAAEIVGRFKKERKAWPAVSLTTDTSILTAIGNDYGFDDIFARQIEALASAGDIVIGISTSGNSSNVEKALISARSMGCYTAALLGKTGGSIKMNADLPLIVSSQDTARIQENHIIIIHIICDLVERLMIDEQPAE